MLPKPKYSSPYFHPLAMLVGGIGSFLNTCTFTAFAVLHPLLLLEPSWGIVKATSGTSVITSEHGISMQEAMVLHSNLSEEDASRVSLILGS
jgi:hypothetical protein